jgi:predicted metal-binding protein
MLRATGCGPSVVVCKTCRIAPDVREDDRGERGGALLAAALRMAQADMAKARHIAIEEMPCLFACQRHCTVLIRAPGRISYVLGDFTPDLDSARAILGYAVLHTQSDDGVVPYAQWPEGVKGHFIARTPPEGFICT